MEIGTVMTLKVKQLEKSEIKKYRCKIVEHNEQYLFIDYPIEYKTNKTALFLKGTIFTASYIGKDGSIYKFEGSIEAKMTLIVPVLAIKRPEKNKIERIQRRQFVRVGTAADVAVHGQEFAFTTVTCDISGGGISFVIPPGESIALGAEVEIWLVLPMKAGDYYYIHTHSEIIRIEQRENTAKIASLKFLTLPKAAQQHIIRYCFQQQLAAKKKELY